MVNKKQQFQSLVIGGTGATGKCLLELLLRNEKCKKVTHIGRSPSEIDYKGDKLVDITIESMFFINQTKSYWLENDIFFNCIGTTRSRAGSAKSFVDIELGISKIAARMASESKIKHASLISAQGANPNKWGPEFVHPLLYLKTMGEKEQTITSDFSFNSVSIFRPGFLNRSSNNNPKLIDKLIKSFSLPVYQLAKAMMLDAEKSIFNLGSSKKINFYEGNQKIKNLF